MGIFTMENLEQILRVLLAALCGAVVGYERKKRSKSAGIRTHIIVSLSSALMMIVSKYGFFDVIRMEGASVDVSRIAAGVVTAIGFLGVGVIFVRKQAVSGVTTAAGLWATVGIGIAIGAGMYVVGVATTLLLVLVQFLLHLRLPLFREPQVGTIQLHLDDAADYDKVCRELLEPHRIRVSNISVKRAEDSGYDLELYAVLPPEYTPQDILDIMKSAPCIRSIDT